MIQSPAKPGLASKKKKSILEIAASFWDEERQDAFKTIYGVMRIVDDIVDDRKKVGNIIQAKEALAIEKTIQDMLFCSEKQPDSLLERFNSIKTRFSIPDWTFRKWHESMVYDIYHDGFPTFRSYLKYAEGASIAPGAIFLHLCLFNPDEEKSRTSINIRKSARPLALFCYLVHILRDFYTDQLENLHFFAHDVLNQVKLDQNKLSQIAQTGILTLEFTELIRKYASWAEKLRVKARYELDQLKYQLNPIYQFSLEVVLDLYQQMLEQLDLNSQVPDLKRMTIPQEEVGKRLSDLYQANYRDEIQPERLSKAIYRN